MAGCQYCVFVQPVPLRLTTTKFNILTLADLIASRLNPSESYFHASTLKSLWWGQRLCAEIIQKINDQKAQKHKSIHLLCKVVDEGAEQIPTYHEIGDLVKQQDAEKLGSLKTISGHYRLLKPPDKECKGSQFNFCVL